MFFSEKLIFSKASADEANRTPYCSPSHRRLLWQCRFKTSLGLSYSLLCLKDCMLDTCTILAGYPNKKPRVGK